MKLINDDCLSVMTKFENDYIDLTVTSPPYDNLRSYNDSLDWGEHVWKPVLEQLYRITKKGGVVVWVVGDATIKGSETGTSFKQALYAKQCGFNLHDTMLYAKNNYVPLTHDRYEQQFEYMFILSKGKLKTFNPIMIECKTPGKKRSRAKSNKENGSSVRNRNEITEIKKLKQKPNIWFMNVSNTKYKHSAIFPEQLAHDHIISWSNEGDTVLDLFMGSGTTGKMAKLNNREFIGIEKVNEYFQIAKDRIELA